MPVPDSTKPISTSHTVQADPSGSPLALAPPAAHHAPPRSKPTEGRENNFNCLRLLLATLVIAGHSPELIDGDRHRELLTRLFHTMSLGDVAVDGFFIISGYLITLSWLRSPRLLSYMMKRVLRIYPGFIVASLVCALIVGPLGANPISYFAHLSYPRLLRDMLVLDQPTTPPVFFGSPLALVNGALWSIKSEFICYLFVAIFGICGLFKRRALWLPMFAVALTLSLSPPLVLRLFGFLHGQTLNPWVILSLARVFTFFLSGVCFLLYRERIRFTRVGAGLAALVLIAGMFNRFSAGVVLSTFGAYLLLYCAFAPWPSLQRIGRNFDLSYGVYLYGWPLQKLLIWNLPGLSPWTLTAFAFACAYACGALSWTYVEKPLLNLKPRSVVPLSERPQIDALPAEPVVEPIAESLSEPSEERAYAVSGASPR